MVFLFYGALLHKKKAELIDPAKHFIIKSAHPSPFLCTEVFLEASLSQKINEYLVSKGRSLFLVESAD